MAGEAVKIQMKLSIVQISRRIAIDLGTALTLAFAGTVMSWACSYNGPLEIVSRYEHMIWPLAVSAIATSRAYLEHFWLTSLRIWLRIVLWVLIVIIVYVIMCWIDTRINPYDNFITVFSVGLLVFLAPSLLVSTAVYAVVSGSIDRKGRTGQT